MDALQRHFNPPGGKRGTAAPTADHWPSPARRRRWGGLGAWGSAVLCALLLGCQAPAASRAAPTPPPSAVPVAGVTAATGATAAAAAPGAAAAPISTPRAEPPPVERVVAGIVWNA